MPIMDGYTASKQMRDMGYVGPIVAMTAAARSNDELMSVKQSGMDAILWKVTYMQNFTHAWC
jgi:CheY-like chemotaxis protein